VHKVEDLRTELVKRGVKAELIDEAMTAVEKKNQPAVTIEATPTMAD
jgi:SOS response regulatory protein OraA/RecX